jgi:pSer/pThr/pTyr-binding forkhead associated (FHA) protein
MEQLGTAPTRTDAGAAEWRIDDDLVRLREWGTLRTYPLPPQGAAWTLGAAAACALSWRDPDLRVSREHALLFRDRDRWTIRDLDSKNGTRLDGARRSAFSLSPGVEIGLGRVTLIAESQRSIALRDFLARLLGWSEDRLAPTDRALRAVRAAATRRAPLLLCGDGDLVPVAQSLHRETLGGERAFVVCDPRRRTTAATVRSAMSYQDGHRALDAAAGGTVCMHARRLPHDFPSVWAALRDPNARVQLVVCANEPADGRALLADPIVIPPLGRRRGELERIVDEYARDALAWASAPSASFTTADREWVIAHSGWSLPEIEKGTRRLVALRLAGSIAGAAAWLGMSHVSLSQWIGRRRLP